MLITTEDIHYVVSAVQGKSEEATDSVGKKYFVTRINIVAKEPFNGTLLNKTITLYSDEKL